MDTNDTLPKVRCITDRGWSKSIKVDKIYQIQSDNGTAYLIRDETDSFDWFPYDMFEVV